MFDVLSVGPLGHQPGGMASVVSELVACAASRSEQVRLRVVDSGGLGASRRARMVTFLRCLWIVGTVRADLAHLHVASRGSTFRKGLVGLVCVLRRLPYGIHLHGASYAEFLAGQGRVGHWLLRLFFRRARYVVVLGEAWRDLVVSDIEVDARRVFVVHNGVSAPARGHAAHHGDDRVVLFLGRIEELKGVRDLLVAWSRINAPGTTLVIAGTESSPRVVAEVEAAADDPSRRISYRGLLTREQSVETLQSAHCLVLPSYAEGLPMALIEAMACGVPCISTRVGAIEELVEHGVNGYLIEPGDVDALERYLRRLVMDDDVRDRLSHGASLTWERGFRADDMYMGLERIWLSVLGRLGS
jgi:glycosyltransferase involved in cell wall biosynthesis